MTSAGFGLRPRRVRATAAVGLWLALGAAGAAGQEVARRAVPIDYVGVEGVYLSVGTDRGLQVGDTLSLFASDTASAPMGVVLVSAASRSRSVVQLLDAGASLARGDVIYLDLTDEVEAEVAAGAAPAPAAVTTASFRPSPTEDGPRLTGRLGLDLDARETRTSWEGEDLFGETRRRYATPVSTLSLRLSRLPGGFTVESNVRASYRYSDGVGIRPTTSVRVYNLSVTRDFEAVPVQLRAGRFHNPYESYSSYWDGALLRVGGRRGGLGVVAGFDPERSNEGLSQDVGKITAFADLSRRFGAVRYDADVSFHLLRPRVDGLPDRSFAGWSQRVSFGRVDLDQRLRLDWNEDTGEWSLAQLRLRGGLQLSRSVRLRAGLGRTNPAVLRGAPAGFGSRRDEVTAGLSYFGGASSLGVDVGSTRWADEDRGLSLSGAAGTRLRGIRLYASGRRWWRSETTSLSVAPGLGFDVAWISARLGYQLYRTDGTLTLTSHAGSLELSASPAARIWVTVRGEQQWGSHFEGTRVRLSVGRSF